MAIAFSSSDDVISREITAHSKLLFTNVADEFDVSSTVKWISEQNFTRFALQFPDELMGMSVTVVQLLQQLTMAEIVILADTSYGSCCVDEVAAEHYNVDAIVHYGHACLSPTPGRLPVHFVFGHRPVSAVKLIEQVSTQITDCTRPVLLLYDTVYHRAVMNGLAEELKRVFTNLTLPNLSLPEASNVPFERCDDACVQFGRSFPSSVIQRLSDYVILYLGNPNCRFLTAVLMTVSGSRCVSFDPETAVAVEVDVKKALAKRFYLIERARDAQRVGILVGTLGVADHLEIAARLELAIHRAGKAVYRFVVGKPNPAKLANFSDMDVFVLIACPENSLVDSKEFLQPIVTPFEMELACNPSRQWMGTCELDFRQLLPGGLSHCELSETVQEQTDVSLISGKLRRTGLTDDDDLIARPHDAVVKRNEQMVVANNSASSVFAGRSWQGLDPQLGKTPVQTAVEGSTGLAMQYSHEPRDNTNNTADQ